jgi:hypothetical protein
MKNCTKYLLSAFREDFFLGAKILGLLQSGESVNIYFRKRKKTVAGSTKKTGRAACGLRATIWLSLFYIAFAITMR